MKNRKKKIVSYGTTDPQIIRQMKAKKIGFIVASCVFFAGGITSLVFGLYRSGWNWLKFLQNNSFYLAIFVGSALIVLVLTLSLVSKGNKGYGND